MKITLRLTLVAFCAIIAIATVQYFRTSAVANFDPAEDAELKAWIARTERDPDFQRLRRLDQTPGSGGILVDEEEIRRPIIPQGAASAMDSLAPIAVRNRLETAVQPLPTNWEVKQQVRKEIERARVEEPGLFGCAESPCK